ncbi:hypothetical protein AB0I49_36115 [Streptomyces sp. NPDC050617]|uniref:hypothetical protein n=1 Tax=Streptomyces sp. NPDC050617 TaxID=3154628 RepID=UPI003424A794
MNATRHATGVSYPSMAHWLAASSPRPRAVHALWAQGRTATLISGPIWDTVEMPLGLAGLASTYLAYRGRHVGPYLLCGTESTAWWLVGAGLGQALADVEHVKVLPPGSPLTASAPGTYNGDRLWVLPEATAETPRPWLQLTSAEALLTAVAEAVRSRHPAIPPTGLGHLTSW